ncbi:MAG: hypothetical protein IPP94_07570 [Ignavibacteria bacterium]|nr:hypothetical protein [Ignavibacteria bacterium]
MQYEISTVLLPVLLLLATCASAQERPLSLPFSRVNLQPDLPLRLSSPSGATFGSSWFGGMPWIPPSEPSLAQRLFTEDMLRAAMVPDQNRSLRIYKSDPRYYRIASTNIMGPSRVSPGPTKNSFVNDLISALYVGFREKQASKHLSGIDYLHLPHNTGQLLTMQDVKEKAWMLGEEQADELHAKIDLRAWPYTRSADSIKLKALLGL